MRGAWLPAGRHRLTYRYRPPDVVWGAWLSGIGWLGVGALVIATIALWPVSRPSHLSDRRSPAMKRLATGRS